MRPKKGAANRRAWIGFLVYCVVAVAGWVLVPHDGFWINDTGLKFLQARMIESSEDGSARVRLPLDEVPGADGFTSIPQMVLRTFGGGHYILYPTAFPRIAATGMGIAGDWFAPALPLLAGIGAVFMWMLAGAEYSRRARWVIPLLAAGSPLMFYHWVFWEHTLQFLAVACGYWGVLRGLRTGDARWSALGGVLLGVGVFFRFEVVLLGGSLALAILIGARRLRDVVVFGCGFALPVVILAVINQVEWGSPMGLHFTSVVSANQEVHAGGRLGTMLNVLVGLTGLPVALFLSILAAGLTMLGGTARRRRIATTAFAAAAVCALVVRGVLLFQTDGFRALLEFGGWVTAAPIFLVGLARAFRRGTSQTTRVLAISVLLCVAITALTCPDITSIGMHFGPRILLSVFVPLGILAAPFLEALAARNRRRPGNALSLAVGAVFLIGAGDMAASFIAARRQKEHSAALAEFVLAQPERFVVTDTFWFSPLHPALCLDRAMIYLPPVEKDAMPRAIRLAQSQGATSILFASHQHYDPNTGLIDITPTDAPNRGTWLDVTLYRVPLAEK